MDFNLDKLEPDYAKNATLVAIFLNSSATEGFFQDDGVWLVSCSFIIFTMVSGFGLLESGRVSSKDEVNIMVKNVVDVVFGGITYWALGFGFTFGEYLPNPFIGLGRFFYDPGADTDPTHEAWSYVAFLFQISFSTTTSTIVSAAMAERIRLRPYVVMTSITTLLHSVAAHWVWSKYGFLSRLGCIDAAGCSVVHLVGGVAGLVSTLYLGPRQDRFGERSHHQMSNPTNALLGTFMLWWGFLGFNTGSTYGIVIGRWRLAARTAVVTVLSSVSGGCTAFILSLVTTNRCQVDLLIDGLLGSLVATTAICHTIRPIQSVIVGAIGAALALGTYPIIDRLEIDDPVGVIPVHVVAATWGMLSVGLLANGDRLDGSVGRKGLFYGGDFYLLGIQLLAVSVVFIWASSVTFLSLYLMDKTPWKIRMSENEEKLGADLVEHGLAGHNVAKYDVEREPITAKTVSSIVTAVTKWKRIARRAQANRTANIQTAQLAALQNGFGRHPIPSLSSVVDAALQSRRNSMRVELSAGQSGSPKLVNTQSVDEGDKKEIKAQRSASVAWIGRRPTVAVEENPPNAWNRLKRRVSPSKPPTEETQENSEDPWRKQNGQHRVTLAVPEERSSFIPPADSSV